MYASMYVSPGSGSILVDGIKMVFFQICHHFHFQQFENFTGTRIERSLGELYIIYHVTLVTVNTSFVLGSRAVILVTATYGNECEQVQDSSIQKD